MADPLPPPLALETELERRICADPEWRRGAAWGRPRPGHPEGSVAAHVTEVLANVDADGHRGEHRRRLRLIALLHDACKHQVDRSRPRSGPNHHGHRARCLTERFLDDRAVLDVIELHDEAYNAWAVGRRREDWIRAERRAHRLLERLGDAQTLFLDFYRADNATGTKSPEPVRWFEGVLARERARPTGSPSG